MPRLFNTIPQIKEPGKTLFRLADMLFDEGYFQPRLVCPIDFSQKLSPADIQACWILGLNPLPTRNNLVWMGAYPDHSRDWLSLFLEMEELLKLIPGLETDKLHELSDFIADKLNQPKTPQVVAILAWHENRNITIWDHPNLVRSREVEHILRSSLVLSKRKRPLL